MGRHGKKKADVQGGEELKVIVSTFRLLAAVGQLIRTLSEWSGWDSWPHL